MNKKVVKATDKATVTTTILNLLVKWQKKGLATDYKGNNFQSECKDLFTVHIKPESTFKFLSELQSVVETTETIFCDGCCTIFSTSGVAVGVILDR